MECGGGFQPVLCKVCKTQILQLREVRKGINAGRRYLKCPDGVGCGFFMWAEDWVRSQQLANPEVGIGIRPSRLEVFVRENLYALLFVLAFMALVVYLLK